MIDVAALTKRFGRVLALDGIDLTIARGESVALWGPNGAGKSTILHCILGLVHHAGSIRVAGLDARRDGPEVRTRIGFIPQTPTFFGDLTVAETIAFSASLHGLDVDAALETAMRDRIPVDPTRRSGTLSGGERRRLALAVALVHRPDVLLLDEPLSDLDAGGRAGALDAFGAAREAGCTILFTSHHIDEVAAIADRVVTLDRGRVTGHTTPDRLATEVAVRTIRLTVEPTDHARVQGLMSDLGFAARANGHGVLIDLPPASIGSVVASLVGAGVPIQDIEVGP